MGTSMRVGLTDVSASATGVKVHPSAQPGVTAPRIHLAIPKVVSRGDKADSMHSSMWKYEAMWLSTDMVKGTTAFEALRNSIGYRRPKFW
jgi:hypothetical protein